MAKEESLVANIKRKSKTKLDKLCYKVRNFNLIFFFYKFICLFLAALGVRCCTRAFSSCSQRGPLFIVVRGLLTAVASLVAEHRL